jgi:hypothetical protein
MWRWLPSVWDGSSCVCGRRLICQLARVSRGCRATVRSFLRFSGGELRDLVLDMDMIIGEKREFKEDGTQCNSYK